MRSVLGIRVLCAVEVQGSFSGAATALGMTQSAVSQHIAALERQVGLELVLRGTRPTELTPAGGVLASHGQAVSARLTAAERDLDEVVGRGGRHLRLGSFPSALATFVPRAIARLRATIPEVTLSVTDDHMQGLLPRLRDRELDLAVVFSGDELPGTLADDLHVVPLFADPYQLLLPRNHRLARRDRDPILRDLREESWVGGGPHSTWFRLVRECCRAQGFEPRIALASDDYLAVQAFVAAGLGVAVLPGLAAARHLSGVRARALPAPLPVRHIGVAHPRGPFQPLAARAMVRILQESTSDRR